MKKNIIGNTLPLFNRPILLIICACLTCSFVKGFGQEDKKRVNILLILADDMSKNAGVYGEQAIKTPGIDEVAAKGVIFNNAYCTASSCSPSRASILSGRYPHQLEEGANLWGTFRWQ